MQHRTPVRPRRFFAPGEVWPDTAGAPIQAHSAGILSHKGVYYWYGEDKTLGNFNKTGVSVYSSRDLYNWKREGLALPKDAMPPEFRDNGICERPKVLFNAKTGKFVMWMHLDTRDYKAAKAGVAIADAPAGPFRFVSAKRPIEFSPDSTYRDMALFQDTDGAAYAFYASEDNRTMYVARLNDEYTDVVRPALQGTTWARILAGRLREAPAPFKYGKKYYLITSGCTGWKPNAASYAVADNVLGPWLEYSNPMSGEKSETTFDSQSTYVLPAPGKPAGSFIFMADRWNDKNLADSRYVWLPFRIRTDGSFGIAWRDRWDLSIFDKLTQANERAALRVTDRVITENFTGVGFHAEMFLDQTTPEFFDQVIAKRWKELNPAFARIFHRWTRGQPGVRDQKALENFLKQFLFMKEATGTEVYLTTGSPKEAAPGEERAAYAKAVVDELEYLLKGGATNLTTYNMSNELSMRQWASMTRDLPTFKDYHRLIHEEIARRGLKIALLSTDASPISNWNTIQWAAQNMDDITEVYGGHHYANDYMPQESAFYDWFRERCAWGVGIARSKGKEFILGEFGPAQYLQHKYGVRWDASRWFGTEHEAMSGLQLAEATLGAINGGVRAMGYWTFMDYPDSELRGGINQWGLFKWMKQDALTRAPYYSYGLMTKFFHGPSRVYEVKSSDGRLRVAAAQRRDSGKWSIAVVNRGDSVLPIALELPGGIEAKLRKYEYAVASVPTTEDGDLQAPSGTLVVSKGRLNDEVKPNSLTVYTGLYDGEPPAPVEALRLDRIRYTAVPGTPIDAPAVRWQKSASSDVIYYRVYYQGRRIGSTTSTEFIDADVRRGRVGKYGVAAVDSSGNASRFEECDVSAPLQ
jgi:hypothetical protein